MVVCFTCILYVNQTWLQCTSSSVLFGLLTFCLEFLHPMFISEIVIHIYILLFFTPVLSSVAVKIILSHELGNIPSFSFFLEEFV